MFKFAFLINVPGADGSYSALCENDESYNLVEGIDGIEAGAARVSELAGKGIDHFNLCGDFDDEMTEKIRAEVGDQISVKNAFYSPEELEKLGSMYGYGMIIKADGVDDTVWKSMKNDECETTVAFVKDLSGAKAAAKQLAADGIDFIELCSWFDSEKTREIIESIDGAVAVGSCGISER